MKIERVRFSIAAAVALCGAGFAQSAPGVRWCEVGPGDLWARGDSYKCSFTSEGATYVPFLGSAAPRNHPLALRLAHVSVGGLALPFEADVAAARSGERIAYDRGSLVEVYDLEPSQVEQSFVFESLPRAGELVLRIAAEGDLAPGESQDGLEFRDDRGSVRYGRATVVDAAGRSACAPTTLASGGIEIRVPAGFLAAAAFPVVVDPLLSTFAIDNTGNDDYSPDVAYDATTNHVATVYEQAFSQTDHDVIANIRYDDGAYLSGGYMPIDFSSENWQGPRIANLNASDEFLVVAQAGAAGLREIRGRLILAQSLFLSAEFTISGNEVGEKINPTVGGDPSPSGPSYFCVAWERVASAADHDILARLVDMNGFLLGSHSIFVENTSATLDQFPSLSKNDGQPPASSQAWTLVWQRHAGAGDEDVYGAQIARDGTLVFPTFPIETGAENALNPRVSSILDTGLGNERRYLVAWQRTVGSDWAISLSLRSGPSQFAFEDLNTLQGDIPAPDKVLPALDSDGTQFCLVYNVLYSNGLADVHLANVYSTQNGLGLSERLLWVTTTQDVEMRPRVVSRHGSGGTGHGYFIVWDRSDGVDHDVEGREYVAPAGGPQHEFCSGWGGCPCGNDSGNNNGCANSVNPNGARLGATGATSVSQDTFVLSGSGMLANSTCIYLQGTVSQPPAAFGDGQRCVGGTLIRLKTLHNVNGASTYPAAGDPSISVRGQVPLYGATRCYQVWYRDPANYCTATTYNISNGIEAVWTP